MRQPIGQRDLLEPLGPEDLHEDQIRVASVLDVMAQRLFYIADVARMKVRSTARMQSFGLQDPYTLMPLLTNYHFMNMTTNIDQFSHVEKLATLTQLYLELRLPLQD